MGEFSKDKVVGFKKKTHKAPSSHAKKEKGKKRSKRVL